MQVHTVEGQKIRFEVAEGVLQGELTSPIFFANASYVLNLPEHPTTPSHFQDSQLSKQTISAQAFADS